MQERLSTKRIQSILRELEAELPHPPVAVQEIFTVANSLSDAVLASGYSEPSMQAIANHIGFYLGLLSPVRVRVGVESAENMIGIPADVREEVDRVGYFRGGSQPEVGLTKKFQFRLKHILAILAHESTHHYLYSHNVRRLETRENEILTDVACCFLGMGHLLVDGYAPVKRTTFHSNRSWTECSFSIGYIDSDTALGAVLVSTRLRGWDPIAVSSVLPKQYRFEATLRLLRYRWWRSRQTRELSKHRSNHERRREDLDEIYFEIERLTKLFMEMPNRLSTVHAVIDPHTIESDDGRTLVKMAHDLDANSTKDIIAGLEEDLSRARADQVGDLDDLKKTLADTLCHVQQWDVCLKKYESA